MTPHLKRLLTRRLNAHRAQDEGSKSPASPLHEEPSLSRRDVLALSSLGALTVLTPSWGALASLTTSQGAPHEGLTSREAKGALPHMADEHLWVPEGYHATRLISWGDRLKDGATLNLPIERAEEQLGALGYNNDFITYHPLPVPEGSTAQARRALLSINHEYTNPSLMFPNVSTDRRPELSVERSRVEMAAVGHSVIEVARDEQGWRVVWGSRYARRLSALGPVIPLSGPVRGDERVKTKRDPQGLTALGTFSNCAGGQTPWGTTLLAEENFTQQFVGDPEALSAQGEVAAREVENLLRADISKGGHGTNWHLVDPRFSLEHDPREPNCYGWVVELDPRDPTKPPVKRTALGRFKHECATCVLTTDGRVVVYSGDDQEGEHLYRFVSARSYDPKDPSQGWGLLDEGTLQVARFEDDGGLTWLNLTFGEGPLTPENRFTSQADVLIEARRAATLLGATPLDRPEDVEVSPTTGRVYVMLTQHKRRVAPAPGSPRAPNPYGHIIELSPLNGDHSAQRARWSVLHLAGPHEAGGSAPEGSDGWLRNPDNGCFDPLGRLWVTADAHSSTKPAFANGVWCCEVEGGSRGRAERMCATPIGAEPTGPCFNPEGDALFLSIQHPGEGSAWGDPSTRWPDFRSDRPPRPSVVVIEREGGGLLAPRKG